MSVCRFTGWTSYGFQSILAFVQNVNRHSETVGCSASMSRGRGADMDLCCKSCSIYTIFNPLLRRYRRQLRTTLFR